MKDNIGLQFVDTNILVYAHDISAGRKHEIAKKLLKDLWNTRNGCLSTQVLSEFYVTITKKVKRPLSPSQASQIISDLGLWKLDTPNVEDILDAIQKSQRYMISFWDSLIVCSAINLDCSIIWSEDLNSGQYFDKVKVVNPFL
ncbi:twitching motility protein PilT [Thermoanaerobacterium thermosaccharolyticum]|uniref:Twitching motility protein n=1 Tax=Thermoanaerobacterium thermosaccharolyticum TaxID=1517 RepID=A0A223I1L8_THETR|nr:PIN domain-containing protein [Thermoanaerobacterium thermosaccharolyticum]AST58612.1 twitching motility protein [Thermoanaerobacterium thermosaccharolyticum]PHO07848.1 twitching motility protein PilT [Thermoanaerobacterium thermosaccharolyticum]